jgi:hypothetical protein
VLSFTSYLESPLLGCEQFQDLRKVAGRSQQLGGYTHQIETVRGTVEDAKLTSVVSQRVQVQAAFEAAIGLSVIVEESGTEESLEGAREGGSKSRFVPIQKDARCCYV